MTDFIISVLNHLPGELAVGDIHILKIVFNSKH